MAALEGSSLLDSCLPPIGDRDSRVVAEGGERDEGGQAVVVGDGRAVGHRVVAAALWCTQAEGALSQQASMTAFRVATASKVAVSCVLKETSTMARK